MPPAARRSRPPSLSTGSTRPALPPQAPQFIGHGHLQVDGERVDIPSYDLSPGQEVRIKPGSRIEPVLQEALELTAEVPPWRELDRAALKGIVRLPQRAEFQAPFDETQIIKFHSR